MAQKKRKSTRKKKKETQPVSAWSVTIFIVLAIIVVGLLALIYFPGLTSQKPKLPDDKDEPITKVDPGPDDRPDTTIDYVSGCLPVYYYDAMSQHFTPMHFPLNGEELPVEIRARRIMERLIAGPPVEGLIPVVPTGTKLNSVKIEGDLIIVDLSEEVMNYKGGSTSERLIVQSIVLSLTELKGIERIQLLIGGKKEEYLPQGTKIDEPMRREGGPNSNETVPEGKTAGYLYFIQKDGEYLTPIYWTWQGDDSDPKAKLETLYTEPEPQLSHGLASPSPPGMIIEKCEITGNKFTLIIDRPYFSEAFKEYSAEKFLQATILTMYNFLPFSEIDIRVGDEQDNRPIWTYQAFAKFENMPVPPSCYNHFKGNVEPVI